MKVTKYWQIVTEISEYCEPFMASVNEPESRQTYLATEAFTKVSACSTSYHYSRSDNVVPVSARMGVCTLYASVHRFSQS